MNTALKGNSILEKKIVSISSKRQITIPQKFFAMLGFTDEAECIVRGNELVIRPARQYAGGEFAEQILADLIAQGLSGEELLTQFKKKQTQVRPAVEAMIAEAIIQCLVCGAYIDLSDVKREIKHEHWYEIIKKFAKMNGIS